MSDREKIRAAISNAFYEARNSGGTMETAADLATDAVLAIVNPLREPTGPKLGGQRQGGRDTAATAAELVVPKMGTQRATVLAAIEKHVRFMFGLSGPQAIERCGLTDVELARHTELPANSVRPRRVELVDAGWVRDTGNRREHNGRAHVVWGLTLAAAVKMGATQ